MFNAALCCKCVVLVSIVYGERLRISLFFLQFKEMGGSSISRSKSIADAASPSEQQGENRKNFLDWRNLMKPLNEEKDHWVSSFFVSIRNEACLEVCVELLLAYLQCKILEIQQLYPALTQLLLIYLEYQLHRQTHAEYSCLSFNMSFCV
jgi:hypothetical protein